MNGNNNNSFDAIYDRTVAGGTLQYAVIRGSSTTFLIKAGLGGNVYGYENKYLHMAVRLHETYGYTIVVADNPQGVFDPLDDTMEFVTSLVSGPESILFMGVSNGALLGAQYGWKHPLIKRMLLVNVPLMINWHRTKEGLKQFRGEKIAMIYGDRDPSFRYCGMLSLIEQPSLTCEIVPGADHNFAGLVDVFERLPEKIII